MKDQRAISIIIEQILILCNSLYSFSQLSLRSVDYLMSFHLLIIELFLFKKEIIMLFQKQIVIKEKNIHFDYRYKELNVQMQTTIFYQTRYVMQNIFKIYYLSTCTLQLSTFIQYELKLTTYD